MSFIYTFESDFQNSIYVIYIKDWLTNLSVIKDYVNIFQPNFEVLKLNELWMVDKIKSIEDPTKYLFFIESDHELDYEILNETLFSYLDNENTYNIIFAYPGVKITRIKKALLPLL